MTYSNNVAFAFKGAGTKIGVQARGNADNISFINIDVVAAQRSAASISPMMTAPVRGSTFTVPIFEPKPLSELP